MVKTRLIACIFTKEDLVVQSFGFHKYLPIGNVRTAIEFFNNWDVDEIILVDIDASKDKRKPKSDLVRSASAGCFIPLTVGGGITALSDIQSLLNAGADKVCINSAAYSDRKFIQEASNLYGSQCITISIDVKKAGDDYFVYNYRTGDIEDLSPVEYAKQIQDLGAGEIFINSVDRDGSRRGYDLDLISAVSGAVNIPVITVGGVGKFSDLVDGILIGGCQAAAAGNIFNHTEHSTIAAKSQMLASGVNVRLSSTVKYLDFEFDVTGRPF